MSHPYTSLTSSCNKSRLLLPHFTSSYDASSALLLLCHTGQAHLCIYFLLLLPAATGIPICSFWQVRPPRGGRGGGGRGRRRRGEEKKGCQLLKRCVYSGDSYRQILSNSNYYPPPSPPSHSRLPISSLPFSSLSPFLLTSMGEQPVFTRKGVPSQLCDYISHSRGFHACASVQQRRLVTGDRGHESRRRRDGVADRCQSRRRQVF